MVRFLRLIAFSGFISLPLLADSWAPPQVRNYTSENGAFEVEITPAKKDLPGELVVRKVESGVKTGLWRATIVNSVAPTSAHVSDTGEHVVTIDNWYSRGYGDDVVVIYGKKGFLEKYSLEKFAPAPKTKEKVYFSEWSQYRDIFPHSTSSRHWSVDSYQYFHPPMEPTGFFVWLPWFNGWIGWDLATGQLMDIPTDTLSELNSRAFEQASAEWIEFSRQNEPSFWFFDEKTRPLRFFAWRRDPSTRKHLEAALRHSDLHASFGSSNGEPAVFGGSSIREMADHLIAKWDGVETDIQPGEWDRDLALGHTGKLVYLGDILASIEFPHPISHPDSIHVYLLPESVPLANWPSESWEHRLTAEVYEHSDTKPKSLLLNLEDVFPGSYRLKVILDKEPRSCTKADTLCRPDPGDYESISSPVIRVKAGRVSKAGKIECLTKVGETQ